jgi:hypothetical protein
VRLVGPRLASSRCSQVAPRRTARSSSPSASQSPTTATSPGRPHTKLREAVAPGPLPARRYQRPARNTPIVSVPSPSQSPTTGWSPRCPKPTRTSGPPSASRSCQAPSRNRPTPPEPSPSRSPATGCQPAGPSRDVRLADPSSEFPRIHRSPRRTPRRSCPRPGGVEVGAAASWACGAGAVRACDGAAAATGAASSTGSAAAVRTVRSGQLLWAVRRESVSRRRRFGGRSRSTTGPSGEGRADAGGPASWVGRRCPTVPRP